jgi:hypothetical protein
MGIKFVNEYNKISYSLEIDSHFTMQKTIKNIVISKKTDNYQK